MKASANTSIKVNALSTNPNPTKWSNTLKQFVGNLPTKCSSVFDHFVGLALKGLFVVQKNLNNHGIWIVFPLKGICHVDVKLVQIEQVHQMLFRILRTLCKINVKLFNLFVFIIPYLFKQLFDVNIYNRNYFKSTTQKNIIK